jgi:2-iminobutanoate/2-iminopropanoate deaminase
MPRQIATDQAPAPKGYYSQAVQAGEFLFISGQLPLDTQGQLIGAQIREQTTQTLNNITAILTAAGATVSNLVSVTIYISDISLWPAVNALYEQALADIPMPPARAIVPVKTLHFGALIEIQAVAFLGT